MNNTANFEPVWISSTEHLAEFSRILREASWLRRVLSGYKIPPSFPSAHVGLSWVPVVYFASGALEISDQGLIFQAARPNSVLLKYRDLRNELRFSLATARIRSVEWAKLELPGIRYYVPPYIKVDSDGEGSLASLLICVGGSGPSMTTIRHRTEEMYRKLRQLMS